MRDRSVSQDVLDNIWRAIQIRFSFVSFLAIVFDQEKS